MDDRLASVGEGFPTLSGCLCLCSADQCTRDLCQESCRLGTDVLDVLSELWRITVSGAETPWWCKTHAYSTKLVLLDDRRRLESCCLDHEEKERLDRVNAIANSISGRHTSCVRVTRCNSSYGRALPANASLTFWFISERDVNKL